MTLSQERSCPQLLNGDEETRRNKSFQQEPEINGTAPNGHGYEGTWSQGQDIATLVHTVMVLDAEARP